MRVLKKTKEKAKSNHPTNKWDLQIPWSHTRMTQTHTNTGNTQVSTLASFSNLTMLRSDFNRESILQRTIRVWRWPGWRPGRLRMLEYTPDPSCCLPTLCFLFFHYYDDGSVITKPCCMYYTILFVPLFNIYGYSCFHIYPVTCLSRYIFILINHSWLWLFPLLIHHSAISYQPLSDTAILVHLAFFLYYDTFIDVHLASCMYTSSTRCYFLTTPITLVLGWLFTFVVGRSSILPTPHVLKALAFPSAFITSVDKLMQQSLRDPKPAALRTVNF